MALLDDLLRQFPTLQVERDIDAYLLNHYPQSYRDVVDADMEMGRSYHGSKVFTGPGGEVIGLNLYKTDLTDEQAQWLIQADWPQLRVLNLARNQLTRFVLTERMRALTRVGINHNEQLQSLRCEDGLDQLRWVDAAFCDLRQFRVPKSYTGLQFLRLDGNKQLGDFRFDGPCPWLEVLFLRGGSLKFFSLPAGFDQLVHLYLNQNQIETLELAGELGELRTLQLRGNKLESLPASLIQYPKLEALYVGDNPLSAIPNGIITKEKDQSSLSEVLSYLRESVKGERPNTRVKLVLVGNGRTGKTSLYRRLKNEPFNPYEEFTHGVKLGQLDKQHLPEVSTDSLELQVWDFGGQEIFYATHQFFLNDNALYLLTWTDPAYVEEARKRIEPDFPNEAWRSREYWLENIRHHAPGSPILMVQTFADKRKIPIDEAGYYEQPYRAACLTFDASNDLGLAELRREVGRKLSQELDFLGMPIANTYLDAVAKISEIVDEKNQSLERPVISWADFEALCREIGLEPGEENARNLCRYLHHAGSLVYFGDDARFPNLRDLIFIDPDWLTTQVYKLVNPSLLHSEPKGRITAAYMAEAWSDFSPREQVQMLELLTGFDLIFKERGKGDRYIAPQYLPETLPEEAQDQLDDRLKSLNSGFSFRFTGYMPDNVTVNFLCKYGPYSRELYWRTGIAFKNEANAEAVVRFDPQARLCEVHTAASPEGYALQREICQAFLILSRQAPAEISLDGAHFVSWRELTNCFELGNLRIQARHIRSGATQVLEASAFRHFTADLRSESHYGNATKEPFPVEPLGTSQPEAEAGFDIYKVPIYFSHAWADNEGANSLVNLLYEELEKSGFRVIRDKEGIPFGGSIEQFMGELGQAPLILVFSSEKYAQSPNCLFELYEIARHAKWEKTAFQARILPVLVKFVNFTEPDVLDTYFAHWEKQEKKWKDFIEARSVQATPEQFGRYQRVKDINAHFGKLADWLADLNGSKREELSANNFEMVKQTILQRLQTFV